MRLDELPIGKKATITEVLGKGMLRRRLLEMGLTPRASVYIQKEAPSGDPIESSIRGYQLTLRKQEATNILVVPQEASACEL